MEPITAYLTRLTEQVVTTLQLGTKASDVFLASYLLCFLPDCPTSSAAPSHATKAYVQSCTTPAFMNINALTEQARQQEYNTTSPPLCLISNLIGAAGGGGGDPQAEHQSLDDVAKFVNLLVFSRLIEIHLALSPSPFENKRKWYSCAGHLGPLTEESLKVAARLLKRGLAADQPTRLMASGVVAMCAAVVMRALHVEHLVERLRDGDRYLAGSLKPLEVAARYARELFNICSTTRSIDQLAVHCPFFVVIAAVVVDKIPGVKNDDKRMREEQFVTDNPRAKTSEEAVNIQQKQMISMHKTAMTAAAAAAGEGAAASAGATKIETETPSEHPLFWTQFFLDSSYLGDEGDNQNQSNAAKNKNRNFSILMGDIPPGVLAESNSSATTATSSATATSMPVGAFVKIFIAGRLAIQHARDTSPFSGSAGHAWQNSARAYSLLASDEDARPFAEIATVARLRMGDVPVGGSGSAYLTASSSSSSGGAGGAGRRRQRDDNDDADNSQRQDQNNNDDDDDDDDDNQTNQNNQNQPQEQDDALRALGCTILEDVSLALRCGHPAAFEAAVRDASAELASRGLLASVMTLRTHAVMMLLKKFIATDEQCQEARRLDVQRFFARYRSQLPATLLETEMELIAPLILGQRLKGRLEEETVMMAAEPFNFDK